MPTPKRRAPVAHCARFGAESCPPYCRRGRCFGASERADATLHPARHLPSPVHAAVRLRSGGRAGAVSQDTRQDRKSTRLNSSHVKISYAVFCLKKKKKKKKTPKNNKKIKITQH